MKPTCTFCGHPASIRYLVFAKGDNPPPERRAEDAVGKVCGGCKEFLTAHPEKAGLPRSCRHDALEEFHWGALRAKMAAVFVPAPGETEDDVFGRLQ